MSIFYLSLASFYVRKATARQQRINSFHIMQLLQGSHHPLVVSYCSALKLKVARYELEKFFCSSNTQVFDVAKNVNCRRKGLNSTFPTQSLRHSKQFTDPAMATKVVMAIMIQDSYSWLKTTIVYNMHVIIQCILRKI